jgi:outer membrane protein assembly complex protein YaeT
MPVVRRGLLGAIVLCLAVTGRAGADVADYLGKPVGGVRLFVETRETTDPALMTVVETVVGQPLSMAQVRESVAHLFSLGRFEDVRVDATLANGRVVLRYELVPAHPITRIRFEGPGGPGIDTGGLRRSLTDRYGASPALGRVADMTRLITDALREQGYLHPAAVTPRAEIEHAPERATLIFTIAPGVRTTVGAVEIVGRPTGSKDEFLKRLGVAPGSPFQREALNTRIEQYIEERRRSGYYEAKIVPDVALADGDRVVNLRLTVAPGPHVSVVFAGDPLPADQREAFVPVEREGSVDEDLLEDSSNRIEDDLRGQGYRDAKAPYTRSEADNELVITFTVSKGRRFRVSAVEISGNASIPLADFAAGLRLKEGTPFSESRLDADVLAIENLYRRRGFASARARPAVEPAPGGVTSSQVQVVVRIVITEGVSTTVEAVTFEGNLALDQAALGVRSQPGEPFVPQLLAVDRDAILLAYQNLGYQSATVEIRPRFSQDGTRVALAFNVREGPQIFIDHVLIVGNVRTRTETIERELQVKPGDPFSLEAINESQRRLTALGLFRRARITELRHGDERLRDVLVTIEEAPPTTIGYGGGLEGRLRVVRLAADGGAAAERFEVAPRAFFDVGRRNLFGKNRSANLFASVSLHPKDSPFLAGQSPSTSSDGGYGLTEYRLIGTFREPRVFDTAADAFINVTFEQQIRSSFNFARRGVSADLARHLTRFVTASGSYQLQRTRVFDSSVADQALIDRIFSRFRLSSFSGFLSRDTRSDPVDPNAGAYLSANAQLAARAIGSEVGFVKSFFTAQTFRALPRTSGIVFAGSARLGLAAGFPREAPDAQEHIIPVVFIRDLPQSERFYAGGDSTIRGFALDRVGTHHVPAEPSDTLDQNLLPKGGNGLVILNAELRVPVWGGLAMVGFFDTGNVFSRVADIDLGELRSAVGGGIRYKSPVGPIRLDLGFKVNRRPGEGLTAWFISFGQAF